MKLYKLKHTTMLLSLCAALAACSDELLDAPNFDAGKSPIELKVGDDSSSATRAVVIDGKGKITAFEKDTRLHLLMISHDKTKAKDETSTDKYTETYGEAKGSNTSVPDLDDDPAQWSDAQKESAVSFESGKGIKRYWDDAHGRESLLSIYGFANVWAIQPTGSPWYPRLDRTEAPGSETGTETSSFPATWGTSKAAMGTFVGGSIDATYNPNGKWIVGDFTPNNNKQYQEQTKTSILSKDDICYSNNLADYTGNTSIPEAERTDNRPHFDTEAKKFTTDNVMVYRRAMCLFTFKVYMGAGFSESDFKFKDGTNIAMKGFNKKGFLNIKTGEWTASSIEVGNDATYEGVSGYSWSKIDLTNEDKNDKSMDSDSKGKFWQLLAFAIPGTDLSATPTIADALTMNINGNIYRVSMQQLLEALKKNGANCDNGTANGTVKEEFLTDHKCLKAGINYEFSFTIGKTAIDNITAKIVDWETVVAVGQVPDNAYVKLQLKNQTGNLETGKPKFDFYRAKDPTTFNGTDYNTWAQYKWGTTYKKAEVTETNKSGTYRTDVFWENNETFYHFRTVNRGLSVTEVSDGNDHVTMYSGPINDGYTTDTDGNFVYNFSNEESNGTITQKYNDYIWGAPFKKATGNPEDIDGQDKTPVIPTYSLDYGFCNNATADDGQIYKAIGATKDLIFFYQFHMMSNIYVDLATTDGADKVNLTGATIKLVNYAKSAKLQMGDAKIVDNVYDTGGTLMTADHHDAASPIPEYDYSYRVIPQSLKYTPSGGSETTVGLVITCQDKNVYVIEDLSLIKAQSEYGGDYITKWLPGKKYYYKFTLKQTGIETIQATIVDWETVEADNQDVQIK